MIDDEVNPESPARNQPIFSKSRTNQHFWHAQAITLKTPISFLPICVRNYSHSTPRRFIQPCSATFTKFAVCSSVQMESR